jgi:hypothetical protein
MTDMLRDYAGSIEVDKIGELGMLRAVLWNNRRAQVSGSGNPLRKRAGKARLARRRRSHSLAVPPGCSHGAGSRRQVGMAGRSNTAA